ncbi:MAG: hypothetical protein IKQ61_08955 [Spirochaetales bacterium]|nr:hypothetical protein [Spirochaetales bacterium]
MDIMTRIFDCLQESQRELNERLKAPTTFKVTPNDVAFHGDNLKDFLKKEIKDAKKKTTGFPRQCKFVYIKVLDDDETKVSQTINNVCDVLKDEIKLKLTSEGNEIRVKFRSKKKIKKMKEKARMRALETESVIDIV